MVYKFKDLPAQKERTELHNRTFYKKDVVLGHTMQSLTYREAHRYNTVFTGAFCVFYFHWAL